MKKLSIVFIVFSSLIMTACKSAGYPQAEITNGILKANFYLPDNENGYYKGTRFDWSGVISNLEYEGHTYFGQWFDNENPQLNAIIMGPVEAYGPLDYNKVEPGNNFVKIGVGALTKTSNEKYTDFKLYPIVNPGTWQIITKKNEVQFIHALDTDNFSYEYTKSIRFVIDEPKMIISHSLKNNGNQVIKTFGFNHNFFVIDNQPIGKDFELSFPVAISGTGRGMGDIFEIQENKIVFKRDVTKEESIAVKYLEGINSVKDFDIRVENLKTGAGVRITGDRPLSRLRLWGNSKTVCPETYINLKVEPGEVFSWNYTYQFYILETPK